MALLAGLGPPLVCGSLRVHVLLLLGFPELVDPQLVAKVVRNRFGPLGPVEWRMEAWRLSLGLGLDETLTSARPGPGSGVSRAASAKEKEHNPPKKCLAGPHSDLSNCKKKQKFLVLLPPGCLCVFSGIQGPPAPPPPNHLIGSQPGGFNL